MYYSLWLDLGGRGRAFDLVEPRAQQADRGWSNFRGDIMLTPPLV